MNLDRSDITVSVGDRRYSVDLDKEMVWAYVHRKGAWRLVRCTSRRIETQAILRASDLYHSRGSDND